MSEARRGLSAAEVERSRAEHGANVMSPPPRSPWYVEFFRKFDDPVIRILLLAAGVSILIGEVLEGGGIAVAVLLATALSFLNEYRAGREFDALNVVHDDTPFTVIRDGEFHQVPLRELVVGDLVELETGAEIPADGVILESMNCEVDQSSLTGESVPVAKSADPDGESGTAYRNNQLLRGCLIADGRALMEVTAVGDATEIGITGRAAMTREDEPTPLTRQLGKLSRVIGVVGFGLAALTFAALLTRAYVNHELEQSPGQWWMSVGIGLAVVILMFKVWQPILQDLASFLRLSVRRERTWQFRYLVLLALLVFLVFWAVAVFGCGVPAWEFRAWIGPEAGHKLLQAFMIAVAVIVVAVPEGLVMSVTLSLAYGMRKMTAEHNLVRRMHACETIGAATVICTDKTGTLTYNQMSVVAAEFPGVAPELIAEAIAANSTAQLELIEGAPPRPIGNPTEGALLLHLAQQGGDYRALRESFTLVSQLSFTTRNKFMATLGRSAGGGWVLHVKGAPEIVLARSVRGSGGEALDAAARERWNAALLAEQSRARRTLAFACRRFDSEPACGDDPAALVEDLTFLGFVAIADPVREEVPAAIRDCRRAGIEVKVVTGDTAATATEIGRQIGLEPGPDGVLTGAEFEALSDEEASRRIPELKVMARARPLDKMRLVKLLQARGEVAAVTGDGTNDAPALNSAAVGIAMGRTGTAVAREAADIILLDDSFPSIVNAVVWGRTLFLNIRRFLLFQLTINVVALSVVLLGPVVNVEMPLTVIQMLWVNLIMDTFAALALATEPPDRRILQLPPRRVGEFIISGAMARGIFFWGFCFTAALVGMLLYFGRNAELSTYELTVFFTVFVLLQFWNLFNAKCFGAFGNPLRHLFSNRSFWLIAGAILIGQFLIVQFGGRFFRTEPLTAGDWGWCLLGTFPVFVLGMIFRALAARRKERACASVVA